MSESRRTPMTLTERGKRRSLGAVRSVEGDRLRILDDGSNAILEITGANGGRRRELTVRNDMLVLLCSLLEELRPADVLPLRRIGR